MENQSNLETSRQQTEAHSKMAVAAIARGKPEIEDDEPKEDPLALVTEAIGELKEAVTKLENKPAPKPRKFKVKRDKSGEMTGVEEET